MSVGSEKAALLAYKARIQDMLAILNSQKDEVDKKIADYQANLAEVEAKIAALGTPTPPTPPPTPRA